MSLILSFVMLLVIENSFNMIETIQTAQIEKRFLEGQLKQINNLNPDMIKVQWINIEMIRIDYQRQLMEVNNFLTTMKHGSNE